MVVSNIVNTFERDVDYGRKGSSASLIDKKISF